MALDSIPGISAYRSEPEDADEGGKLFWVQTCDVDNHHTIEYFVDENPDYPYFVKSFYYRHVGLDANPGQYEYPESFPREFRDLPHVNMGPDNIEEETFEFDNAHFAYVEYNGTFITYLMYESGEAGSIPVPLKRFSWSYTAHAHRIAPGLGPANWDHHYTPDASFQTDPNDTNTAKLVTNLQEVVEDTTDHPEWSSRWPDEGEEPS